MMLFRRQLQGVAMSVANRTLMQGWGILLLVAALGSTASQAWGAFTVAEGATFSGAVTEGSPAFAITTGPTRGTLVFNPDGSFSYTAHRQPWQGFVGEDSFEYDNQEGTGPHRVAITITPVNDAPIAMDKSFSVSLGSSYLGAVSAIDVDGDALTYALVSGPSGGTLVFNADGSFTFTANAGVTGADSFGFLANDGLADSNVATVSIEIEPVEVSVVTCANENPQAPATTPTDGFIDHGDGTVTHQETGLVWMRCSLGQSWDAGSGTCLGGAGTYSWSTAHDAAVELNAAGGYAGFTDWRVPNKNELASIVEERCWGPAVNLGLFPETIGQTYWTSSPSQQSADTAWVVLFEYGQVVGSLKWADAAVRLVRAGH